MVPVNGPDVTTGPDVFRGGSRWDLFLLNVAAGAIEKLALFMDMEYKLLRVEDRHH